MPTLVTSRRITVGSVALLPVWLNSNGTATLSAQAVFIAIQPRGINPNVDTTWRTATWAGTSGTARAAQILIGPGTSHIIPVGTYDVWSKIVDSPETPETLHGRLTIY